MSRKVLLAGVFCLMLAGSLPAAERQPEARPTLAIWLSGAWSWLTTYLDKSGDGPARAIGGQPSPQPAGAAEPGQAADSENGPAIDPNG
jgi:hypothetical protein